MIQPKKRSEEQKLIKEEIIRESLHCINIGETFQWWKDLRELKDMKMDVVVALFLHDKWVTSVFAVFHRTNRSFNFVLLAKVSNH